MSKYAVIDLEMCRVPWEVDEEVYPYGNEIIQVGAVLLDEKFEETGTFCSLVAPRFGKVDDFITRLTGITQRALQNARDFREVLTDFVKWLPEEVVFVAWSDSDERQLRSEIDAKGLEEPIFDIFFEEWEDCQQAFSKKLDTQRVYKLSEALCMADIYYDDGAHDALVDAKNTAKLFKKIKTEEKLKLSPYLFR